ncbi:MAG: SRPBCC domain-containing protein [Chitinophagaceae bacterium]|nr:MAG: SRPBCC domain-containing protein [Chitinophagaceae bacterium]
MSNQTKKVEGLKIVRQFNAPKQVIFDAFSTAEAMSAWWGPAGMEVKVKTFDFTPGGTFHYSMEANGQTMWGLFKYETITPPSLITFISSFSDEQANICTSPFPMDFPLEIFNEIILTEDNGITTLTLQGHPIHASDAQTATYHSIKQNMHEGFGATFDQLEKYLNLNC